MKQLSISGMKTSCVPLENPERLNKGIERRERGKTGSGGGLGKD